MKVKITQCSYTTYWYKNKIGMICDVKPYNEVFYVLTDNVSLVEINDCVQIVEQPEQPKKIDTHYNFNYALPRDMKQGETIKVDPYFVSHMWNLGGKDPSGVIWHIFKTCARFGEKNDKAREITAIYKSIKRLAELEGVTLD